MPRNGSGVYTLPAGNPVVDGTIIDTNWANPTMEDIAYQLNNVLTRDGLLTPAAPFKVVDGSIANPGLAFQNAAGTGLYKSATAAGFSYAGVSYWSAGASGMNVMGLQLASGAPSGAGTIGSLLVGGSTINPLAVLDVQSTTKAFKLPVMTTAQKNAIGNSAGLVVFDSTLGMISSNNGSVWAEAGGGGGGGTTAASITNVPFGSISATNVQAAINELDSEKMPYVVPGASGNLLQSNGTAWISAPFSYTFNGNVPGNLTFQTAGSFIYGNFSDTVNSANRVFFKSSAAGNPTYVSAQPAVGGAGSGFVAFLSESVAGSAYSAMTVEPTEAVLMSGRTGAAAFLPLAIRVGGSDALSITTDGQVDIGDQRTYAGSTRKLTITNPSTSPNSNVALVLDAAATPGVVSLQQLSSGELVLDNGNTGATSSLYIRVDGGKNRMIINTTGVVCPGILALGDATYSATSIATMYSSSGTRTQLCSANNIGFGLGQTTNWAAYSTTTGNFVVTGTLSQGSDERLKKDWGVLPHDFVTKLSDVKNGTYTLISNGERYVGVSAQSLQTLMPEAVGEDDAGMLTVNYGNAALAACIELAKEVKALRARVEQLEGLL